MSRGPTYGTVDREYALRLASTPPADDGPIWMVNLMSYREVAAYADGHGEGVTGREADERYAPVAILRDIGAEVVLHGDVDAQLLGSSPRWDRVGIVRYPTRRAFIDMQSRPDFRSRHVHKEAGMAATIVMGCHPAATPSFSTVGGTADWSTVPHPPTPDDGPVMVVHVIRYVEGVAAARLEDYQDAAAVVAARHGGSVAGWFDVEGTIVGDGRQWDQVRCNLFPSKAAFMAVVSDPERLVAHHTHRETAVADTYTLVVRPAISLIGDGPTWQ